MGRPPGLCKLQSFGRVRAIQRYAGLRSMSKSKRFRHSTPKSVIQFGNSASIYEMQSRGPINGVSASDWYQEIVPRRINHSGHLKRALPVVFFRNVDGNNLQNEVSNNECAHATICGFRNFSPSIVKSKSNIEAIGTKGAKG